MRAPIALRFIAISALALFTSSLVACSSVDLGLAPSTCANADAGGACDDASSRADAAIDASPPDDATNDRNPDVSDGANDRADTQNDDDVTSLDVDGASTDVDDTLDANTVDAVDARPCDPTQKPSEDSCVIDEKYGVFVSPAGNDTTGTGTRAAPYKTIGAGLAAATNVKRVYACNNGTPYAEQVLLTGAAQLFGGFACADWTYVTTESVVVKAAASPALSVQSVNGAVTIEDVRFEAPDATIAGKSSIAAVIASSPNVVLHRVRLIAGKGAEGVAGADGGRGTPGPNNTAAQYGKIASCMNASATLTGGSWPAPTFCGTSETMGGKGGDTVLAGLGSPGAAGTPGPPNGGAMEKDGLPGIAGAEGTHGTAGSPTGTFSALGFTPASAGNKGTDGTIGQGGGGGGGASSQQTFCIGGSGGAGGMGGCGGKPGLSGSGGGASIALLSWQSGVTLDSCALISTTGGKGGQGGKGGAGGYGSAGAPIGGGAINTGIPGKGGDGGKGGPGGSGGGGSGGPSYALAVKGTRPQNVNGTTLTSSSGGAAGVGGSNTTSAPDGVVGDSAPEVTIP